MCKADDLLGMVPGYTFSKAAGQELEQRYPGQMTHLRQQLRPENFFGPGAFGTAPMLGLHDAPAMIEQLGQIGLQRRVDDMSDAMEKKLGGSSHPRQVIDVKGMRKRNQDIFISP